MACSPVNDADIANGLWLFLQQGGGADLASLIADALVEKQRVDGWEVEVGMYAPNDYATQPWCGPWEPFAAFGDYIAWRRPYRFSKEG